MAENYVVKRIDDMESAFWGAFKRARAELGVTSFGMQVFDLPPHAKGYPDHDHAGDGQEEVYVTLRGSAEMVVGGDTVQMTPDVLVAVPPATKRVLTPGADGIRMLVIGGVPGQPYEVNAATDLGAPDPAAGQDPPQ